jgi:hypothetical protein
MTTPSFETRESITVARLARHIECEVYDAYLKYPRLYKEQWVAAAILALQVDEDASLTPSLAHIHPITAATSLMFSEAGKFDTSSQRIFTENMTIEIRALVDAIKKNSFCSAEKSADTDLAGDLGIAEVVKMGFSTASLTSYHPSTGGGKDASAFGESVQFIVTMNLNGVGPTWTLKNFKGPGGLFGVSRMDTHKLTISFAPPGGTTPGGIAYSMPPPSPTGKEQPPSPEAGAAASAAATAAMNNNILLLQQSLPGNIARQLQ